MNATPANLCALFRGMREATSETGGLGISAVEALFHIATGADNTKELERRMGLTKTSVGRTVCRLCGRGAVTKGRQVHKPLGLIQRTKHPHIKGAFLLELSEDGRALIASTFGSDSLESE